MDQLFGREDNDRAELFEPENGIMMCADAEKRIENGWMVLVPDVQTDATTALSSRYPTEYSLYRTSWYHRRRVESDMNFLLLMLFRTGFLMKSIPHLELVKAVQCPLRKNCVILCDGL